MSEMRLGQQTYLLSFPETALLEGNNSAIGPVIPVDLITSSILLESTNRQNVDRLIFAHTIPYLPDFLSSPHLVGRSEAEKIQEILKQQIGIVKGLAKWKGIAFSLRYIWKPAIGEIRAAIVGAVRVRSNSGLHVGREVAGSTLALLHSMDIPADTVLSESALWDLLNPLSPLNYLLEIRQHEEIANMIMGDAYVVHPFRLSATTWISLFRVLKAQDSDCFINIHLQPTSLNDFERETFARAAQIAATVSDYTIEKLTYQEHISDPIAREVARLYSDTLRRLVDPLLLVVQVGSRNPVSAMDVAQTFGNELSQRSVVGDVSSVDADVPSGFDLVLPDGDSQLQTAKQTLTMLDLNPWGKTEASPGKERLRYLADVNSATAAFRFPIAVHGGMPGMRVRALPPSVDPGFNKNQVSPQEIPIGRFLDNEGIATLHLPSLTRHTLIAGTNGSGKTTTCFKILIELWTRRIPFLVIEPEKTEYRSLLDSPVGDDLQIFTLGDETVAPFRLNPLEIMPGVKVESHIANIRACFEASLPKFGIFPSLIAESLQNIYVKRGWTLNDRGKTDETRRMPVIGELYQELLAVAAERGYSAKMEQDVAAAATGRFKSLFIGSIGQMLNTQLSFPMEQIMNRPTILELEQLPDDDKSLVMLFLLVRLREFLRLTRTGSQLAHITVIEEAHRLATKISHATDRETNSDSRASGADQLTNALSEVRAYGEGLIIAEQIPRRLIEDALKNTNTKIIHKLPGGDDRDAVANTMNLSTEQTTYMSRLPKGQALFSSEELVNPTLINVTNSRTEFDLAERISENRVSEAMKLPLQSYVGALLPFDGCRLCQRQCEYRGNITPIAYTPELGRKFADQVQFLRRQLRENQNPSSWSEIIKTFKLALAPQGLDRDPHAAYCLFTHLWSYPLPDVVANQFRAFFSGGSNA